MCINLIQPDLLSPKDTGRRCNSTAVLEQINIQKRFRRRNTDSECALLLFSFRRVRVKLLASVSINFPRELQHLLPALCITLNH